ncbi:hypothetical protein O6P43_019883 [Quillaja saponaria]|uniref:Uncharacterized protein n=1 Tax=Quillaja saponaria TaxID=32244 RepID=A0AAD7LJK6_QUISA|nr:hypothetical protein O6P43_019883 [Quillaja saponaria]
MEWYIAILSAIHSEFRNGDGSNGYRIAFQSAPRYDNRHSLQASSEIPDQIPILVQTLVHPSQNSNFHRHRPPSINPEQSLSPFLSLSPGLKKPAYLCSSTKRRRFNKLKFHKWIISHIISVFLVLAMAYSLLVQVYIAWHLRLCYGTQPFGNSSCFRNPNSEVYPVWFLVPTILGLVTFPTLSVTR